MELRTSGPSASQAIRRGNAAAVLAVLCDGGERTATEIVAATGLSRPTVHDVCGELIGLGWIGELDPVRTNGPGHPGRSARRYQFRRDAGVIVGVDLGAHSVTVAVADPVGDMLAEVRRTYRHSLVPAEERLADARIAYRAALDRLGVDPAYVLAVAVGVPGPVDRARGMTTANESFLPGIEGVDLRIAIGQELDRPVEVENDCNLAALGERWRGGAQGADDLVVVLAGERVGAGVILNGRLVRGSIGSTGELSYLFLLDGVGSAAGIAAVARELGEAAVEQGWDPGRAVDAETVFEAAASGDPIACDIVDRVGARFARVAATLALLFGPQELVFAGAVAAAGSTFLPAIRRHIPEVLAMMDAPPFDQPPRVSASPLGDVVVVTGAVRLALDTMAAQWHGATGLPLKAAPSARETA